VTEDLPSPPRGTVRLDRSLTLAMAALAVTLATGVVACVEVRIVAPGLDLVLDTLTTFVALAVVVLAWARFRDRGQRAALFQAAAFLVLAIGYGVAAALEGCSIRRVPRPQCMWPPCLAWAPRPSW
jgi:hypothetical protein